jgi:hypothetical protein
MRRCFSVLLLCLLSTAFAMAVAPRQGLTQVKWGQHRDKRVQRHQAHKAGKHHTPKRQRHTV